MPECADSRAVGSLAAESNKMTNYSQDLGTLILA